MRKGNLEKFINRAIEIHGNKYDYSLVLQNEPQNVKSKITLICPIHGEFETNFDNHVNFKSGCPKCAGRKKTTSEFIKEVAEKNINKNYTYECTEYVDSKTKVKVFCHEKDDEGNEHGIFEVRPDHLKNGHGCPKCANRYISTKNWVKMAKSVHGNEYDYSKVKYINNSTKICIICPKHGEFWQMPYSHINGNGCPVCNGGVAFDKEKFVSAAMKVHNSYYSYDKFVYVNARTKGIITCPRHGDFEQTPYLHVVRKHGCPKCKSSRLEIILSNFLKKNNIDFKEQELIGIGKQTIDFFLPDYNVYIECQGEQHYVPTKFNYSMTNEDAELLLEKIKEKDFKKYYKAKELGRDIIYFTLPNDFHVSNVNVKNGFYKDKYVFTSAEDLVNFLIKDNSSTVNCGTLCDFMSDVKNITDEITVIFNRAKYKNNLIYFNLLDSNDSFYMSERHRNAFRRGYKVLDVFEDEYVNHKEIVISKIKHILGFDSVSIKIDARKCLVKTISNKEANEFLSKNHIQGFVSSSIYYGCFNGETLVAVMSFLQEQKDLWNLTRFATLMGTKCRGVASKILKKFIIDNNPKEIKSFADKRWTPIPSDNLYTKLGFKFEPSGSSKEYRYWKKGETKERMHKFGFRKEILHKKYGLPLSMTETEMTKALGYVRIWDCGLFKYVWRKKCEE